MKKLAPIIAKYHFINLLFMEIDKRSLIISKITWQSANTRHQDIFANNHRLLRLFSSITAIGALLDFIGNKLSNVIFPLCADWENINDPKKNSSVATNCF